METLVILLLVAFCGFVASVEPENSDYNEWYTNVWCKHYFEWVLKSLTIVCLNQLVETRKRTALGAFVLAVLSSHQYEEKRYWVSPALEYRPTMGYYRTGFSVLLLEDLKFRNFCRMSPTRLESLVQLVGGDIHKQSFLREAIPVRERLVLTLRFMASGESMASLSNTFLIGNATVCNIIHETTVASWKNLMPIAFKRIDRNDWRRIATDFDQKTRCPHCLGAIDGKHICPPNAGSSYHNYKGTHSIILLAVCDSNYNFLYFDVGSYGRRSDGGVYAESSLAEKLLNGLLDLPLPDTIIEGELPFPYYVFGDEAFPLLPWLMRPYSGKVNCSLEKRIFNYRMGVPRRFIENSSGILSNRWRIFRQPIPMQPIYSIQMVKAALCLHNWLRMTDEDYIPQGLPDRVGQNGGIIPGQWREERQENTAFEALLNNPRALGREAISVRERFRNPFNTLYTVPWQYKYV